MFLCEGWDDYAVLDTGDGEKLERWGEYVLRRPDPQVIWPKAQPALWERADAWYVRGESETGRDEADAFTERRTPQSGDPRRARWGGWRFRTELPERWTVSLGALSFYVRPTGFKHTGLFPEQAENWRFMAEELGKWRARGEGSVSNGGGGAPDGALKGTSKGAKPPTPLVLNLFAYTGGATLACAAAGARVTHVDAARSMVQWAKENRALSGLPEDSVRYIVEDAKAFVARELRRGHRYDGILLDPPSYGRGPNGEVWKLEDELFSLTDLCAQALSDAPAFFLLNGYTTGFSPAALRNILEKTVCARHGGHAVADELCLPARSGGVLPCGTAARWTPDA